MLFSKSSNKKRAVADENAAVPEIATQAESAKPRATRSSKSKNGEASETASVKHRKAATKPTATAEVAAPSVTETPVSGGAEVYAPATETKAMAAAAGVSPNSGTDVTEAVTNAAEHGFPAVSKRTVTPEEIAAVAYSYWVSRGYAPGSPEQDWLRAERELSAKL